MNNITKRPPTKEYTLREWYNKYHKAGVGFDDRYDRPLVWQNKPILQENWEKSLQAMDTDNPFCYVNCLVALDKAPDIENKNY